MAHTHPREMPYPHICQRLPYLEDGKNEKKGKKKGNKKENKKETHRITLNWNCWGSVVGQFTLGI
jgi:hypothetical protein